MSPVAIASSGISFTVATVDAPDIDFGRKGELIGKRVSFFRSLPPATARDSIKSHSRFGYSTRIRESGLSVGGLVVSTLWAAEFGSFHGPQQLESGR